MMATIVFLFILLLGKSVESYRASLVEVQRHPSYGSLCHKKLIAVLKVRVFHFQSLWIPIFITLQKFHHLLSFAWSRIQVLYVPCSRQNNGFPKMLHPGSRTCEYVTLHGKGELKLWKQLRLLIN